MVRLQSPRDHEWHRDMSCTTVPLCNLAEGAVVICRQEVKDTNINVGPK